MKLRYERRVLLMALAVGFPGVAVALLLLWGPPGWIVQRPWGFTVGIAIVWLFFGDQTPAPPAPATPAP